MAKYLSREEILKARERRTEDVPIPEWDGAVRVRGLSAAERDRWEQSNLQERGRKGGYRLRLENARARLVALTAVDVESGALLFSEEDTRALGEAEAAVIDRLYEAAARLSGITEEDLDELLKN